MIRRLPLAVALFFGCAMSAVESNAAPLTFTFTGTVTQINADPDDPFGGAIAFGTFFTGRYTFESAAVDAIPAATDGSYLSSDPSSGISVNFAGDPFGAFSLADVYVNTRNGSPDQYGVYGSDGLIEIQFLLESFVNPLTSDLLPLVPPAVGDYASRLFTFIGEVDGNQVEVLGTIDSLEATVVPEPATTGLLLLGVAAAARRWRPRS